MLRSSTASPSAANSSGTARKRSYPFSVHTCSALRHPVRDSSSWSLMPSLSVAARHRFSRGPRFSSSAPPKLIAVMPEAFTCAVSTPASSSARSASFFTPVGSGSAGSGFATDSAGSSKAPNATSWPASAHAQAFFSFNDTRSTSFSPGIVSGRSTGSVRYVRLRGAVAGTGSVPPPARRPSASSTQSSARSSRPVNQRRLKSSIRPEAASSSVIPTGCASALNS